MNPLVLFSAFVVATGVRSYLYGPANASSETDINGRSDPSHDLHFSSKYGSDLGHSETSERDASILSFTRNIKESAADATSFSTSNGISSSHNVYLVPGSPTASERESSSSIAMNGHSYHSSPEGMKVSLTWSSDSPAVSHLPRSLDLPHYHAEAYRKAFLASSSLYGGNGNREDGGEPDSYKLNTSKK